MWLMCIGALRREKFFDVWLLCHLFPKACGWPGLRAAEMLPQFSAVPVFRLETFASRLRRILFGIFMKVVLADNIAPLVDAGFMSQSVR